LAVNQGALPPGPVQFWSMGQWREVLLMSIEIHGEADREHRHAPEVERWLRLSMEHMNKQEMAPAEALLKQALAIEPEAPDLLNNLAANYAATGRVAEAETIWRSTLDRHPDYLFARAALAQRLALRGNVAEARELLNPLLTRRRMHFSEFAGVAIAQIETSLADGKIEEAKSWLEIWEGAMPDDPRLATLRQNIQRRGPTLGRR
jgi:tetratricopeptide (TPR) repeat protein